MGFKCFLIGHNVTVHKDNKTTICKRCGYKPFWKKGYAEEGLAFTEKGGFLGFLSHPIHWIPFIVIAIGIRTLVDMT